MKRFLIVILVAAFSFSYLPKAFAASDEEIQGLKQQVQELLKRIEKLEQEQVKTKEDVKKVETASAGRMDLVNTLSKLKMKGRWAAGFFDSGKAGSFNSGSWEIPEGKIQFAFQPDDINTIVMRLNVNNATANSPLLDYFYLQSKDFLPFLKNTPFSLSSRLGRFKLGFGEETWSNNIVESVLPSNSAANTGGNDEALELASKIKIERFGLKPLGLVVSISDGNSGVGSDNTPPKAVMGKLHYTPIESLYLSYSYYDSGNLGLANSELSIGGLASRPVSAATWERKAWELFARYDFGKGKKPLDPPAYSDSKAILRLSYGRFHDESTTDREGNFGFVEGTYNLTKKFYTAGRYSFVDLDGDATATLNSVTANRYTRYSLGVGYRWSENTIIKLGYDWNKSTGQGASVTEAVDDADDNLFSAVVASQF